ncbi:MAG: DUF697 domain-containing protein [Thermoguttaceae bacterium]
MTGVQSLWNRIWRKVLAPEIDPRTLDDRLRAVKSALPPPVIWLLGKAQSGKTSLVHAMTGSSRAEIGGGFRPCTRAARMYSFPNEEECFLRFLDTRGLGEAGQDGLAEIPRLESEADLIIVVVKAMDHAQQPVLNILRGVVARHPDWPILVLQTALHEGYPAGHPEYRVPAEYRVPRGVPAAPRHVLPYPYAEPPYPPSVPHDLARSLLAQRKLFRDYRDRFVPVDFTLPEDGFEPVDYGLEQLWSVIEELLPLGLRGMLGQTPEARQAVRDDLFRKAQPHIVAYAMAAGVAGAVPLPAVDVPLVLTAQARMLYKIAEIYRQPMDITRMAEIAGALGIGFLTRLGLRELLKLVPLPGLGEGVSALYAAASTYALGVALCQYFGRVRGGAKLDVEVIRRLYAAELKESKLWIAERMRHQSPPKEPDP